MVERAARGRIMVPAAAALGAVSAGFVAASPVTAASRDTTLQIRVQVVEACQIRLTSGGVVEEICGNGGAVQPRVTIRELIDRFEPSATRPFAALEAPALPLAALRPGRLDPQPQLRAIAANQRAVGIAEGIAQRVRLITLAY